MISAYSSSANLCGLCSYDISEIRPTIERKEDYLQINLDGNDTTLFIRETSVEDLRIEREEEIKPFEEDTVVSNLEQFSSSSEEPPRTSARTKTVESVKPDEKTARNKQFNQLYFKKWSGKTYFEEELRKIRIQEYQRDLEEAITKRNLWKAFQKDIAKERKRDLIKTSGPEWWQEPSRKQICLATSLGDVITTDYEEGVTGRTRQWLLDLGVTTRVTPKQVRACMKSSLLDPIDFLLETHSVVLKSQLNMKKKRGELERPFSVNERLLLTAVCVLHLPTLLTMLHYILPPPKPYSTEKHIQELLFGDLDDERVRYSTPYMEPIPFRNQSHFLNWAEDKVFRALLPSIVTTDVLDEHKRGSLSFVIPHMKMSLMSQQIKPVSGKRRRTSKCSYYSTNTGDSITWLIAQCITKRQLTESLYPFYDVEDRTPKAFSRKVTKRSTSRMMQSFNGENYNGDQEEGTGSACPSVLQEKNEMTSGKEMRTETLNKNVVYISDTISYSDMRLLPDREPHYGSSEPRNPAPIEFMEDILPTEETYRPQDLLSKHSQARSTFEATQKSFKFNNKDEILEKDENEFEPEVEQERSELQTLWDEIAALPQKQQLQHALGVLRGMGDPLARLPNVHMIPTVLRWLELRRGKNRILSEAAKEELLRRSRGMWKMAPIGNATDGPKVNCSKRVERLLTWNKKKWLSTEVNKAVRKYYAKVKEEKVENARTFFPTMLNHYDHGSKLNRNFRDVFFTYLPARADDTLVYRPWQTQETKKS